MNPRTLHPSIAALLTFSLVAAAGTNPSTAVAQVAKPNGAPRYVWVTTAGFPALDKPETGSKKRGTAPLKFLQKCAVRTISQGEQIYYEVGMENPSGVGLKEIFGWVPAERLILNNKCLGKDGTLLDRKLLTVFRVPEERPAAGVGPRTPAPPAAGVRSVDGVTFRDAPGSSANVLGQFKLLNIFWIYQEWREKRADGREKTYLLAGTGPRFLLDPQKLSEMPDSVVKGWVDRDDVLLWTTRLGRQWDQASTLGASKPRRVTEGWVYRTPADAYAHLYPDLYKNFTGNNAPAARYLYKEEFVQDEKRGKISPDYDPKEMRYPRLDDDAVSVEYGKFTRIHPAGDKVNQLQMIGAFGGFAGMSAAELGRMRQVLLNLEEMMKTTEIIFVIDDTFSLNFEELRNAVVNAIRSITAKIEGDGDKVKIGALFFNDMEGRPADWKPTHSFGLPLRPIAAGLRGSSVASLIEKFDPSGGGGGSPRELVFYGLKKAIEEAKFTTYARKLVVLIGDAGDHSDENDPTHVRELADWFQAETDAPREFLAIQLPLAADVRSPGTEEAAGALTVQCNNLIQELESRKKSRDSSRKLGRLVPARDPAEIGRIVAEGYREIEKDRDRIRVQMRNAFEGKFKAVTSPDIEAILLRNKFDLEKLRKAEAQPCQEGFVWLNQPTVPGGPHVRLTRDCVFLSEREIRIFTRALEPVVDRLNRDNFGGVSAQGAAEKLLAALAGDLEKEFNIQFGPEKGSEDSSEGRSLGTIIKKRMGIDVQTTVLKRDPSEWSRPISAGEMEEITLRYNRLNDILEGVERDYKDEVIDDPAGLRYTRYTQGATKRPRDRVFPSPEGGKAKWYWLDLETEIP